MAHLTCWSHGRRVQVIDPVGSKPAKAVHRSDGSDCDSPNLKIGNFNGHVSQLSSGRGISGNKNVLS